MADDRTYEERVIRISELVDVDGLLEGFRFIKCHIDGPAVIVPSASTLTGNDMGATPEALLWELPGDRLRKVGAIFANHCAFEACVFRNVGIAGPRDVLESLRRSMAP